MLFPRTPPSSTVDAMFTTILVCDADVPAARDALRLARYLAAPDTRFVLTSVNSASQLQEVARLEGADVIVLPSGRSAKRLLHGSRVPVALAPAGCTAGPDDRLRVIGVGFDGQDESRAALRAAEQLALEQAATLRVYSAVQPDPFAGSRIGPPPDGYRARVHESLGERLREEVETLDDDVRAATRVIIGDPVRVLADVSREGLDLLVVGARAQGPVSRVLLGSVSTELADRAACPLLVLPRAWAVPEHAALAMEAAS